MRSFSKKWALLVSWLVAFLATSGSLYFSEVVKLDPCTLCWYQRVCMFPLSIILAIATWKKDISIAIYIFPQIVIGGLIAFYQIVGRLFSLYEFGGCISCSLEVISFFVFPVLSFFAFVTIFLLLVIAKVTCNFS